jgi:hypothetical protein
MEKIKKKSGYGKRGGKLMCETKNITLKLKQETKVMTKLLRKQQLDWLVKQ